MPIIETFAKRKKRLENAGVPVLYQYDDLPPEFRVQVIHIWNGAIGNPGDAESTFVFERQKELWKIVHDGLARELGVFDLWSPTSPDNERNNYGQCTSFLVGAETENALSIIELSFRLIDRVIREGGSEETLKKRHGIDELPDEAIDELNHRF